MIILLLKSRIFFETDQIVSLEKPIYGISVAIKKNWLVRNKGKSTAVMFSEKVTLVSFFLTPSALTSQNSQEHLKNSNCLSVFDHFVVLVLKGLRSSCSIVKKWIPFKSVILKIYLWRFKIIKYLRPPLNYLQV